MTIHGERRERVYEFLDREDIDVFLVEDTGSRRSPSLRYLSGHPNDSLLFLCRTGKSVLMPWDIPMSERYADADRILPYNDFGRRPLPALIRFLEIEGFRGRPRGPRIALDRRFSYPDAARIIDRVHREFPGSEVSCGDSGPDSFIESLRIIKDREEIPLIRRSADIINRLISGLEGSILNGSLVTEADAALYIERGCRELGAEGTSFDTIAAGPARSFGIHAFPNYGNGAFGLTGLSLLDFGVSFAGYAGDVTLTIAGGKLTGLQKTLTGLVEEAYHTAIDLCLPGRSTTEIARAVDGIFSRHGLSMPHSLGHGLGIEVHEAPYIRSSVESETILRPGMVFTIEPGLYDPSAGGVRLENDILITETGHEVLTSSRILYRE